MNARGRPFFALMAETKELRTVLTVSDFDEALTFYRDALGLEQLADWSGPDGRVILLGGMRATLELVDEAQAATIDAVEAGRRVSGKVRLAFAVDDSETSAEGLVTAGARLVAAPVTPPWGGRNVRIEAPDGMQLTLFSGESG
jgi:lactoylglutathione lyase